VLAERRPAILAVRPEVGFPPFVNQQLRRELGAGHAIIRTMPTLSSWLRYTIAMLLVALVSGCASLPENAGREPSTALGDTDATRLGRSVSPRAKANPGLSGIYPLPNARDAFAARVLLARTAERSLDLQYYVWHDDTTGRLLFSEVWQAAERGVRVRMLLDDANTKGMDPAIATLDAHPNIEVRLFNPFANRGFRLGDFAADFARVNRRMHNKSFTADNQVAVVGGRNVGDEYYGAGTDVGFVDLDVMVVGPVVRDVSREFDLYWNSEPAFAAARVVAPVSQGDAGAVRDGWEAVRSQPDAQRYVDAVRETPLVRQLLEGGLDIEWTTATVIHDDPMKVRHPPEESDTHLLPHLERAMGRPARELDLVSPYFVPGTDGVEGLTTLGARGVRVRVLTNSLAGTDVGIVHAGYSKYRQPLLAGGTRLYELKAQPEGRRGVQEKERRGLASSSATGLHAKTFVVDRRRIFVGSFNLDPRSNRLNTEMGVVIDSPKLASLLAEEFDRRIPFYAYEVRLAPDGNGLEWIDRQSGRQETILTTEPNSDIWHRGWIQFMSVLPIEWLL